MEVRKRMISFFAGVITSFFQAYGLILALVCVAIIFDTVTGIVASKSQGIQITSKKANQGFWKKIGLVLSLFFGVFLDAFIPITLSFMSVTLPFNMPFGLVFGCYIVLNESISVAENLDRINPSILPKWVKSLLKGGADKIDSAVGSEEKEDLDDERN